MMQKKERLQGACVGTEMILRKTRKGWAEVWYVKWVVSEPQNVTSFLSSMLICHP